MIPHIGKYFPMKPGSIAPPNIYLSGKLYKVVLLNGLEAWEISISDYIQDVVNNFETCLKCEGIFLEESK